ncbi:MAG: peptidylprolyl isomerase [Planctomycetota bacterium]|jgi:parvulin-like peptidyl-prolyl isomerase
MKMKYFYFILALILTSSTGKVFCEEFSLNDPTVELRQLQFCRHCGNPMNVLHIKAGESLRCPFCNKTQEKVRESMLKSYTLQLCPVCQNAFNVLPKMRGEAIACPLCKKKQTVVTYATLTPATRKELKHAEEAKTALPVYIVYDRGGKNLMEPIYKPKSDYVKKNNIYIPPVKESAAAKEAPSQIENMLPQKEHKVISKNTSIKAPPLDIPAKEKTSVEKIKDDRQQDYLQEIGSNYKVSASVNGEAIPSHEFELRLSYEIDNEYRKLGAMADSLEGRKKIIEKLPRIKKRVIDDLIHEKLIQQKADEVKLQILPKEIRKEAAAIADEQNFGKTTPQIITLAKKNLTMRKMIDSYVPEEEPAPHTIRKYYRENSGRYISLKKVSLRTITVFKNRVAQKDMRGAKHIINEAYNRYLKSREFSLVAEKYSEDIFASQQGRFKAGMSTEIPLEMLAAPVRKAAAGQKPGLCSRPIELPNAFVLILVDKVKGGSPLKFEEVQQKIKFMLKKKMRIENINKFLQKLRERAVINIKQL